MIVWWRWWWSMMFDGDEWSWHLKCIMTRQMTKSHLKPNKVEAVLWFSTDDAKAIFHCEQSLVDLKWFQFNGHFHFITTVKIEINHDTELSHSVKPWDRKNRLGSMTLHPAALAPTKQGPAKSQFVSETFKLFFCRLFDLPRRCGRWIVKMCVPRFLFKTPCFPVDFNLLVQMKFLTINFWCPWTLKLDLLETEVQAVCPLWGHLD